jgi:acyl transferase domain-containing protein
MELAVQALRTGKIKGALVGGVSFLGTDFYPKIFHQRGILSRNRNFHLFDQRQDGVILSEGAGMVLLKSLGTALSDGDRIYGVIKGIGINHDGRTAGPATPNPDSQKELLRKVLHACGRHASEIGYIEVNGTGTEVTDLLELKVIRSVYRDGIDALCRLGSVKPNIGHTLCAEGMASFIKVVLMVYYGMFVPFLSGNVSMKNYDFSASPFYFSRKSELWKGKRIAGINCFADGGSNAHLIIEAFDDPRKNNDLRTPVPNSGKPGSAMRVRKKNTFWKRYN